MPRISDIFLQSIVYLYESEAEAEKGNAMGATGFLIGIPYEYRDHVMNHVYVVTNSHVIEEMNSRIATNNEKCIAIRINKTGGTPYVTPTTPRNWEFHPSGDDIAVAYLYLDSQIRQELDWKVISRDLIITKDMISDFNIGVGTDVYIVGRFRNHPGKIYNKPTVRIGHIALMADENERIEQSTRSNHKQESFVLNCRSDNGFSGSPIFVELFSSVDGIKLLLNLYDDKLIKMISVNEYLVAALAAFRDQPQIMPKFFEDRERIYQEHNDLLDEISVQLSPRLLGVNWGHYPAIGRASIGEEYDDNTDFSCTVPSWKLDELLDKPSLVSDRKIIEERFQKEIDMTLQKDDAVMDEDDLK